jgi:hypothetical protein
MCVKNWGADHLVLDLLGVAGDETIADFRPEFRWASIPQAAVRSYRIVIHPPGFDDPPGIVLVDEPVLVQAFVPNFTWKCSMNAFCTGLPGSMKSNATPCAYAH